jgi:hypothetical protein
LLPVYDFLLAGCAGVEVKRVPATNPKLAAQGWQQAAAPFAFGSYGFTAKRSLVCRQANYGGLGVYRNGSSSLSSGTPLCHAILAGLNSPDMDTAKLREHARFKSLRQCAGQSFNIEDIRKIGRGSHITANGRQVLGGKLGVALMHMTAAGSALSLEATFGKDRA